MKACAAIFVFLTTAVFAGTQPFNVVPSRTIFVQEGDSLTAHQGLESWTTFLTNASYLNFNTFQVYSNVANNGDYLDVSGGIMDEYASEIRTQTNAAYTNLLSVWIGANDGMPNPNDYTNQIAEFKTYLARATNDGWRVLLFTVLPRNGASWWQSGATYQSNWANINAWIRTNGYSTWTVDPATVFPSTTFNDASIWVEADPNQTHLTAYGQNVIATNVFLALTTNVPPVVPVWKLFGSVATYGGKVLTQ